jgi:hypothetical protein
LKMPEYVQYEHHNNLVYVKDDLRGKHREHCLCHAPCKLFKPGESDNCELAQANFEFCIAHHMTLPVWECPIFQVVNVN